MNIAIVGFGVGGANILKTIISHKNYTDDIKIHIFEKSEELSVGIAYDKDTDYKVLNVHERYMSLDTDNPNHFKNWLSQNNKENEKIEGMVPRNIFADYIKDSFGKYIANENVIIHKNEVVDIYKEQSTYKIVSDAKVEKENFACIFLAIGQSYYKDSYNLKENANFIYDPYPLDEKIKNIPDSKTIGIIGAGPTSIDIYRYLTNFKKIAYPLYFLTKENGFPPIDIPYYIDDDICSIDEKWIEKNKDEEGFVSLSKIKDQVSNDFSKYGHNLIETYDKYKNTGIKSYTTALMENDLGLSFAQTYTMQLTGYAALIYNSLNGLDKVEVDEKYLEMIEFIATKTPTITMQNIIEDYKDSKIKVIRATDDIKVDSQGQFIVTSDNEKEIKIDVIINAQGFEKNLLAAIKVDKLLANLYKRKYIEDDVNGKFIRVAYPSYRLVNKKYGLMENFYLNGMWAGGTDVLNNDLRSIIKSGQFAANDFMDKI